MDRMHFRRSFFVLVALALFPLWGCGSHSMTKARYHFTPPFSYHSLEVGPFPLCGDSEYYFDLSKFKFEKKNLAVLYYFFDFPNEDAESRELVLVANSLELDIWHGEKLMYSYRGCIPFGGGGVKQTDGRWGFGLRSERLAKGKSVFDDVEIAKQFVGRLRINSTTPADSMDAKATLTIYFKELGSK